jgi:hypothetical protein
MAPTPSEVHDFARDFKHWQETRMKRSLNLNQYRVPDIRLALHHGALLASQTR